MAVAFRGVSNAAGQAVGATTPANTVSITPTLPASTASGDRVFMIQCASNTSATSPANWTLLGTKDMVVGSGAVAAAGGLRYMTVYYRDYDGVWTMPAMTLTSATQNSHWIGAVSVSKGTYDTFDTPTISTVGATFNTAGTSYTDTSAASFTTHTGGFLIIGSCFNDNVTSSAVAVTQSGATFGTVTERCDGGTATGNDVSGKVHTCDVTAGASATITQTQTISAASQGETLFIEQTVTTTPPDGPYFGSVGSVLVNASSTAANVPVPSGVVADDVILVFLTVDANRTVTAVPSGFTELSDSPGLTVGATIFAMHAYWKRATGADAGTYDFTLGTAAFREAFAVRYSNCITSGNPVDVSDGVGSTSSSSVPATSVTTTGANELLVYALASYNGTNSASPAGFTQRVVGGDALLRISDKDQPTAGASGSVAGTGTDWHVEMLAALKPPGGAAAVVAPGRAVQQVSVTRASVY